jgi:hypothetical protein
MSAETAALTPSQAIEPAPKRFTAAAKEAWASVPEAVRADVLRMEKELAAGLKKHREAAARDAGLAEFHDRAAKGGTTLKAALTKYIGLEDMLRTDPDKGLEAIFQSIGISPREWATKLLGKAPHADSTTEEVVKFAAAHPRFHELADDIVFFLDTGRADNLAEAYDLAERFNSFPAEPIACPGGPALLDGATRGDA